MGGARPRSVLDWLTPAASDWRRARLLAGTCIAVLAFGLALAAMAGFIEREISPALVGLVFVSATMALNLVMLRRGLATSIVGKLAALELLVMCGVGALECGGVGTAPMIWSVAIPLLGGVCVSRRFAAVCAGAVAAGVIALLVLELSGHRFPQHVSAAHQMWWQAAAMITLALFVATVIWLHEAETLGRLEELQADFRQVIEHNPDAVFVCRDRRVIYANPSAVSALGCTRLAELLGTDLVELAAPGQQKELARLLSGHGKGGEFRLARRDRDERELELELSTSIRIDFDGDRARLIVGRDISERKHIQARLVFAERMSTVGTLAAGVAHEVNNPLTFVLANLDRLAMRLRRSDVELAPADRTRLAKAAEDALYGSERVREIVRDLSQLARPEQRPDALVDVRRALESSLRMAGHEIRKRAQLIEQIVELPPVWGNTPRLAQVFLNLLINAVHAVPEGDCDAHSICVRTRAEGERVVIEISDTGCGIGPDVISRVFDPFFTTKETGMGTGLGLSICHGIVAEHGGDIEVESSLGRGTMFRVILPVAKASGKLQADDVPAGRAHG